MKRKRPNIRDPHYRVGIWKPKGRVVELKRVTWDGRYVIQIGSDDSPGMEIKEVSKETFERNRKRFDK